MMKKTFLSAMTLASTLLVGEYSHAGSKWVRLGWQGDASSKATVSFTPSGSNNNPFIRYGYSTDENNWVTQNVTFTTSMASIARVTGRSVALTRGHIWTLRKFQAKKSLKRE
ncbi:MAG: hypothetical protein OXE99_15025, partial [Cellvibrionales bacterium]|nr:hypothetical protein [Cellvibrionales bacterium]